MEWVILIVVIGALAWNERRNQRLWKEEKAALEAERNKKHQEVMDWYAAHPRVHRDANGKLLKF